MFIELFFLIILIFSFVGVLFILIKKIPELNVLSKNGSIGIADHYFILNIRNKVKEILISVEKQIFLHKFLSWVKVMILKIETKVDTLLHKIRRKAQKIDQESKNKR